VNVHDVRVPCRFAELEEVCVEGRRYALQVLSLGAYQRHRGRAAMGR
jgi:hypothetical protein